MRLNVFMRMSACNLYVDVCIYACVCMHAYVHSDVLVLPESYSKEVSELEPAFRRNTMRVQDFHKLQI